MNGMFDYRRMAAQLMGMAQPVADKTNPLAKGLHPLNLTEGAGTMGTGGGGRPPALAPAMRKDGKVYSGAPGEVHADVYLRNRDVLKGQFDEGFVLNGKYLSRREALEYVDKTQPRVGSAYRAEAAEKLGRGSSPESVRGLEALEYNDAMKFFGPR
jgi:hypothetical protein